MRPGDKDFCAGCILKQEVIQRLEAENSRGRSIISLVRRAVQEQPFEKPEDMGSLSIDRATHLLVLEALERSDGNRSVAAELLGVARSTLFKYIEKFNIRDKHSRHRSEPKDWHIEGLN